MKISAVLLLSVLSAHSLASDVQVNSLYQQRGAMLSKLEYALSRDLLQLDPATCKYPTTKEDRIRVLKANTETLEKEGRLTHCSQRKFVGRKKELEDLDAQKKVLENVESNYTIISASDPIDSVDKTLSPVPGEIATPAIPDANENIVPASNPTETSSTDTLPITGEGRILYKEILAGYEGVPFRARSIHGASYFLSDGFYDETFGYLMSESEANGGHTVVYSSKDLPPGINLLNRTGYGSIWGIPKKAGSYSPQFRLTLNLMGDTSTVTKKLFQGSVPMRILPRPRSTVLNTFLGNERTQACARFLNRGAPLLSVKFPDEDCINKIQAVSAINGLRSGKLYYEVLVDEFFPETNGMIWKSELSVGIRTQEGVFADALMGRPSDYGVKVAMKAPNPEKVGDWRPLVKNGDVINVAYDVEKKSLWVGVNGKWLPARGGASVEPDPAKGLGATNVGSLSGSSYLPEVSGRRTTVTFNFGDQPWRNQPPEGFQSIPYRLEDLEKFYIPLSWNTNSGSEHAIAIDSFANANLRLNPIIMSFTSAKYYLDGVGGETMLAEAPKSSGKWQFEISSGNSARKSRMGLAPANFSPGMKLGGAGSLGITHLEELGGNKGVLDIDGKQVRFDTPAGPHEEVRFTFVCDFDSKKVDIFANGKFLFSHALPANPSGAWAIAGSASSSSWVHLHTLKKGSISQVNNHLNTGAFYTSADGRNTFGEMRYPVSGVPVWSP